MLSISCCFRSVFHTSPRCHSGISNLSRRLYTLSSARRPVVIFMRSIPLIVGHLRHTKAYIDLEFLRILHNLSTLLQRRLRGSALMAHLFFRWRPAMRDSAEVQPASNGWPGLSISIEKGA